MPLDEKLLTKGLFVANHVLSIGGIVFMFCWYAGRIPSCAFQSYLALSILCTTWGTTAENLGRWFVRDWKEGGSPFYFMFGLCTANISIMLWSIGIRSKVETCLNGSDCFQYQCSIDGDSFKNFELEWFAEFMGLVLLVCFGVIGIWSALVSSLGPEFLILFRLPPFCILLSGECRQGRVLLLFVMMIVPQVYHTSILFASDKAPQEVFKAGGSIIAYGTNVVTGALYGLLHTEGTTRSWAMTATQLALSTATTLWLEFGFSYASDIHEGPTCRCNACGVTGYVKVPCKGLFPEIWGGDLRIESELCGEIRTELLQYNAVSSECFNPKILNRSVLELCGIQSKVRNKIWKSIVSSKLSNWTGMETSLEVTVVQETPDTQFIPMICNAFGQEKVYYELPFYGPTIYYKNVSSIKSWNHERVQVYADSEKVWLTKAILRSDGVLKPTAIYPGVLVIFCVVKLLLALFELFRARNVDASSSLGSTYAA